MLEEEDSHYTHESFSLKQVELQPSFLSLSNCTLTKSSPGNRAYMEDPRYRSIKGEYTHGDEERLKNWPDWNFAQLIAISGEMEAVQDLPYRLS